MEKVKCPVCNNENAMKTKAKKGTYDEYTCPECKKYRLHYDLGVTILQERLRDYGGKRLRNKIRELQKEDDNPLINQGLLNELGMVQIIFSEPIITIP